MPFGIAKVFASFRPPPGVEASLDDSAPTTFLTNPHGRLGNAVSLRHSRGGSGDSPLTRASRSDQFGSVVATEIGDLVCRPSEALHRFYRVEGRLRRFWVD